MSRDELRKAGHVATLALSAPIVVMGGAFALILSRTWEAIVATVMVVAVMVVAIWGGIVMIRGAINASLAERRLRRAPSLPRARMVEYRRARSALHRKAR